MKISVALAAYKGEEFIAEQIKSVLSQIGPDDEIIVSDDFPSGNLKAVLNSFSDSRIKYIEGEGRGVTKNFENALKNAGGDIIFLCDQDDVWLDNKVETVLKEFEKGSNLVLHNAAVTDASLSDSGVTGFSLHRPSLSFLSTLLRNSYVGCCMAFDRGVLECVLPFPGEVPMHDWYIALVSMLKGKKISFVETPLILWRRHGNNVTGRRTSLGEKLKFRIKMIGSILTVCHGKDKR